MNTSTLSNRLFLHANILVVEDKKEHQQALARVLRKNGWQVWTTGDGEYALDKCRKKPVDIVILDIVGLRSVADGLEIARRIPSIPIIAYSAFVDLYKNRAQTLNNIVAWVDKKARAIEVIIDEIRRILTEKMEHKLRFC